MTWAIISHDMSSGPPVQNDTMNRHQTSTKDVKSYIMSLLATVTMATRKIIEQTGNVIMYTYTRTEN